MAWLPQRGDPGFTFIGFLILAALGTFFWKAVPLETARPNSDEPHIQAVPTSRIEARLWQDPFKATSNQRRLWEKQGISEPPNQELPSELGRALKKTEGDVLLLAVMAYGGSHAELEERRRRRRYAVLSSLAELGFAPRNPEHLQVFRVDLGSSNHEENPIIWCAAPGTDTHNNLPLRPAPDDLWVPYEWLDLDRPEDSSGSADSELRAAKVVILWVDESRFDDRPFVRFSQLLKPILVRLNCTRQADLKVVVLGPARSGTLRQMIARQKSFQDHLLHLLRRSSVKEFLILSPAATVAAQALNPTDKSLGTFDEFLKLFEQNALNLKFLRTIRTDDELMKLLIEELLLRQFHCERDHLVILSEWDTHFGRRLPKAFQEIFLDQCRNGKADQIVRYSYQRGIDGIIPGGHQYVKNISAPNGDQEDLASPFDRSARVRPPIGTGQFDYLRRLAARIRAEDQELRLGRGQGIRAVAVLGSDVYDKLLILRALRPLLPEAVWLTTDLDAHLLDPDEFKWTRNLVVASSFGLSLAKEAREPSARAQQTLTPPFRDSYQTSFFLATGMAVDPDHPGWKSITSGANAAAQQRAFDDSIPPRLFEIGRNTLVPLPTDKGFRTSSDEAATNFLNLEPPKSFAVPTALTLLAIGVLGVITVNQMLPRSGALVCVLILALVLFGGLTIVVLVLDRYGEPLTLSAGVSIWPTEYIRLATFLLTIAFIVVAAQSLNRNWARIGHRYFGEPAEEPPERLTLCQLLWKERLTLPRPELWVWLAVTLGLAVIVIMVSLNHIHFGLMGRLGVLLPAWGLVIALWWKVIYGGVWSGIRLRSITAWAISQPIGSLRQLWHEYHRHGELEHRVLRTLSNLVLYVAFASMLFGLLGVPAAPCRGYLACRVDSVLIAFCVLAMLFLLFFVVDATRLCITWIELLRRRGLNWTEADQEACMSRYNLPARHCLAWTLIHMIGERTNEVARLIYYPVLVILLLILSRSTFFDAWGLPQALAVVIGINILIALSAAVRLNLVAQAARADILDELRHEQLKLESEPAGDTQKPTPVEVRDLVDQLEKLRTGAYLGIWDRPVVRAFLLLLGAIGITFSEYFALM